MTLICCFGMLTFDPSNASFWLFILSDEAVRWLNYRLVLGGYDEKPLTKLPCCILYESDTEYTWNN